MKLSIFIPKLHLIAKIFSKLEYFKISKRVLLQAYRQCLMADYANKSERGKEDQIMLKRASTLFLFIAFNTKFLL